MSHKSCKYLLRSCVWEITLSCCFSCIYCGSRAGIARQQELSTEECIDVAKQLAEIGCKRVSLIGGEVFMRPDWSVIVKALTDRCVSTSIITNGYLFSDHLLSDLKKTHIESVAVSLDGPEFIHDQFRQQGSYKRAMNAIDKLSENHIPVSVITTLHRNNVDLLDQMYKNLKGKNIFAWQLQACSPMGNAKNGMIPVKIDINHVIHFVEKHLDRSRIIIGIADNIGYFTKSEGFLRGNTNGQGAFLGCRAGLSSIGIDSIGNVRGCESMYDDSFIEGNLREKSLYEIWNDPNAFAYNRKFSPNNLTGKCRRCEYGYRCAGGCRSYNYFTNGNMFEPLYCARSLS